MGFICMTASWMMPSMLHRGQLAPLDLSLDNRRLKCQAVHVSYSGSPMPDCCSAWRNACRTSSTSAKCNCSRAGCYLVHCGRPLILSRTKNTGTTCTKANEKPCTWKTGAPRDAAKYSSTCFARGAPPETMKRTRPPKAFLKGLNSVASRNGDACTHTYTEPCFLS